MLWSKGFLAWLFLAFALFIGTFGTLGAWICLYSAFILLGGVLITFHIGQSVSKKILLRQQSLLNMCNTTVGINQAKDSMENTTKVKNYDRRMTGSSVIDDALQEVLDFVIRDYIKVWFNQISDHEAFLVDARQCMQKVIITFANRSKDIDWMPYFTQRLVDDFASHIRLYRRALDKVAHLQNDETRDAEIEKHFFDFEVVMENMCRDLVCLSPEDERQYLQDLSEVLLFLLLPQEDFHNKPFRFILREVLVNGIFIPTIDLIVDPDYVDLYVAWMCKEYTFTNETFMWSIKSTDCVDELNAVIEMIEQDINKWRSRDTGGSDDMAVKQNLNSLIFVKTACQNRIRRLEDGNIEADIAEQVPDFCKAQNLYVMTLDDIISNNIALTYFIEYMADIGGQHYLFFYLNAEGFRAAAEQQMAEMSQRRFNNKSYEPDLAPLRRAALIIFDQYLSDKASSKIKLEVELVKKTLGDIKSKMLSENVFDEVQSKVYQILHGEQYYEGFLQHSKYISLLTDMGMLSENRHDDGDTLSFSEDFSESCEMADEFSMGVSADDMIEKKDVLEDDLLEFSPVDDSDAPEPVFTAQISQTGIVKESDKMGKSYAVFAITVKKTVGEDEDIWDVYRRYSDFHDLNMWIHEKFPETKWPALPGKTAFKNMSKDFLEKRRQALDSYLQNLLDTDLWQKQPGLEQLIVKFLAPGLWEKHKSELARKMDTIVNPLKTSVKTVSNAVKQVPDGIKDLSGNIFSLKEQSDLLDRRKVGAGLDPEVEENIPLRIMILLMDEVFDLRHKNQWLRRQMMTILKQLIKATFGDTINRKIVDYVDWMTSAEQMSEYVKNFRNAFWPSGILAEPRPTRDLHTKMRTRVVCKAKMLGSVSDDVRRLMGNETIRKGLLMVFDMFQHKTLNRRFAYVFLEGVLTTMFPENKFEDLFKKLHSRSPRRQKRIQDILEKKTASKLDKRRQVKR